LQVALPAETTTGTCFIQHYIESILALQDASSQGSISCLCGKAKRKIDGACNYLIQTINSLFKLYTIQMTQSPFVLTENNFCA